MEAPDTIHHVTARAATRGRLFRDDADYAAWVQLLGLICERYRLRCLAYCLMPGHAHVVLHAVDGQLPAGLQYLAAAFARRHRHRYRSSGRSLQGGYDSMQVNRDAYLLEIVRHVLLNPVRAGHCRGASDWRWSSAREALGARAAPSWMDFRAIYELLGPADGRGARRLERFLAAGMRRPVILGATRSATGQTLN